MGAMSCNFWTELIFVCIHVYGLSVPLQAPEVKYSETLEAQALKKEQERAKEEMKKRQEQERQELTRQLEAEARNDEDDLLKQHEEEKEKTLREKTNKQAAELAAREDLTPEEAAAVSENCGVSFQRLLRGGVNDSTGCLISKGIVSIVLKTAARLSFVEHGG